MTDETAKKFHFEVGDAITHGVEEAVFLSNIRYWLRKNIEAQSNIHDGRVWTFNSSRAFAEIFPFWNERKIARITTALEASGILLSANYNRKRYDRTKWFSINEPEFVISADGGDDESGKGSPEANNGVAEEEVSLKATPDLICQKREMDLSEMVNGFTESVRPIPDVISSVITDVTEELHGNFAGKIVSVSTADSKDDDSSKAEGSEPSKEGLVLVDDLGNSFQRCRQMVKLMTKLRRDEGLDQLIIGRMPIEQWERCENSLDAIFSERASDTHLEQHIFDMLDGPLAKAKKVNLHKLACTHALDSDFDHEHLILNCYGFDNAGYAC